MIELTIEVATVPVCSPMRTAIVNLPGETDGVDFRYSAMLLLLIRRLGRLWHNFLNASESSSVRQGMNLNSNLESKDGSRKFTAQAMIDNDMQCHV